VEGTLTKQDNACAVRDLVAEHARKFGDPFAVPAQPVKPAHPSDLETMPTSQLLVCIGAWQAFGGAMLAAECSNFSWWPQYLVTLQRELKRRMMLPAAVTEVDPWHYVEVTCEQPLRVTTSGPVPFEALAPAFSPDQEQAIAHVRGFASRELAWGAANAGPPHQWARIGTMPCGAWVVVWNDGSITGPNGRLDGVTLGMVDSRARQ
jgi:hypothetical protein